MIELRSKCHRAEVSVKEGSIPGLESYYECQKCKTMCEISLINIEFNIEEKAMELYAWSAAPRTLGECVSWIEALIKELNINGN